VDKQQKATLSYLETELEISPIDNPYDYVKELQSRFDNSGIARCAAVWAAGI